MSRTETLVQFLNAAAQKKNTRLTFNRPRDEQSAVERVGRVEDAWPLDPERPPVEEGIYEVISQEPDGLIANSLTVLSNLIAGPRQDVPVLNNAGVMYPRVFVPRASFFRAVTVRRIIFAAILAVLILVLFYISR